jgi:hypothetical protein
MAVFLRSEARRGRRTGRRAGNMLVNALFLCILMEQVRLCAGELGGASGSVYRGSAHASSITRR